MTTNSSLSAIVFGSSNNEGNTFQISLRIAKRLDVPMYNLSGYRISNFDYNHNNINDDFLPLISELIDKYDTLIFITPVYWYAMSAIMKTFFDRLSDLLTIKKDLGRKLRGINTIFATSSIGNHLDEDFWIPIKATCSYLGINFSLGMHCINDKITEEQINHIAKKI